MTGQREGLDWAGAMARLERMRQSLNRAGKPSPDELRRLFSERAAWLAQPEESHETGIGAELLLVFRLGQERFAIPVWDVEEAQPQSKLAPIPFAPPEIAGVIQVRGEVRPVYNLRQRLGIPETGETPPGVIVLIKTGSSHFGVRVDEVEEVREVGNDERRLPAEAEHVSWTTEDLVSVLDTESLWKREA